LPGLRGREGGNVNKYQVSFAVSIPAEIKATDKQVEEWIQYVCGYKGRLSDDNPLSEEKFDPIYGSFEVVPL